MTFVPLALAHLGASADPLVVSSIATVTVRKARVPADPKGDVRVRHESAPPLMLPLTLVLPPSLVLLLHRCQFC